MDFKLRQYQLDAIDAITASWGSGITRPAVVMPTGTGKTATFCGLVAGQIDKLRAEGKRVLILAHREELLEQAEARVKAQVPGVWTAIVKGGRGQNTAGFADVVIASIQTLVRPARRAAVDRIGMVIVDECHNASSRSYKDVLTHYGCMDDGGTPTVGFTATLTRMDGGLPEVWQSVAFQRKIHWAVKEGFLVPPVAKVIDIPGFNLSTTRVTGGDLNSKDVAAQLDSTAAYEVIADTWLAQASDRPTITFMPNVATCHSLADAFLARGVAAEVATGKTPTTERRETYARLASGETRVLVSCMTLTEGFDSPSVSCVIIGRPTINPGLFIQMVGRGLRLADGKADCLVLDIAGASHRHNLAGVNDLETDCDAKCDCDCLSCGCGDQCKCGIRKCGCRCIEQHEGPGKGCKCAGTDECGCGCPGDADGTGLDACVCHGSPDCGCRGEGPEREDEEVDVEVLRKLVDVDILGAELKGSGYTWLTTRSGIRFLPVGNDVNVFLLPAPDGSGFFHGLVEGSRHNAPVKRLDSGATDAKTAVAALEAYADGTGYTYNNRKASWRRGPASEGQIRMLTGMAVVPVTGLKKGEASDLIAVAKASKALDARFGKYLSN